MRTSKLSVELCAALSDVNKPKSLSKYSKAKEKEIAEQSERPKKEKVDKTAEKVLEKHKDDPQFKEFLKAHKKTATWDNDFEGQDESTDSGNEADAPVEEEKPTTTKKKKELSTEDMLDLYVVKIKNMPCDAKRKDLTKFFKPLKTFSIRIPPRKKGFAYVGFKNESEMRKALLKDKSFLGGHQVQVIDFTQKDRNRSLEKAKKDNPRWIKQKESVTSEDICETGKLFFRNLSYTVKEENLQKLFEKFGPVADLSVPIDTNTRKLKGFGTVTFVMPEHAVKAFTALNGTLFYGRMFHLLPGNANDAKEDEDDSKLSFKEKKDKKLKQNAGSSYNWNTLFMGENVVADILANKYGESKEKILSDEGTSAAVRLALGETEIVMEMRKFLEKNDINVDSFNNLTEKRSKTVILAKNLPAKTSRKEIVDMFVKFGLLGRVVLPPSGVTAVIEFQEPSEAKRAFKNLAYSKFKNLPLFLEWAPEKTFKTDFDSKETKEESDEKSESENEEIKPKSEEKDEDEEVPEDGTTLFIKNLSFETRNDAVRNHFKEIGPIHMVQVVMKGSSESRGYGFIQFKTKKAADKALKLLQFSELDGRKVELSRSDRKLQIDPSVVRKGVKAIKQTGTKILVRNIPFQANVKEVRDLFKVFGEIKTIRLPKKMTPGQEQHRGFCFVEYGSNANAKAAFEALSNSTHLYGRRLVLEWAAPDDDLEMLRKRTAKEFTSSQNDGKRSRKAVFDTSNVGGERETGGDNMEDDDDDED